MDLDTLHALVVSQGETIVAKIADLQAVIETLKVALKGEKQEIFDKIKELEAKILEQDSIPDDVVSDLQAIISDIEGIIIKPVP